MATLKFFGGENFGINDLGGSGLGFFGSGGFGTSVAVSAYADTCYITDGAGGVQGPKCDNVKFVHPNSGEIAGGEVRVLRDIPNYLATLQVQFEHPTPVRVTNGQVRAFDRVNIDNPPSGCTVKAAEIVHPWTTQSPAGSGDTTWSTLGGSGGTIGLVTYDPPLSLVDSPGSGGWSPSGSLTEDTIHTWALAVSLSPDTIGSLVNVGLYVSCEYL